MKQINLFRKITCHILNDKHDIKRALGENNSTYAKATISKLSHVHQIVMHKPRRGTQMLILNTMHNQRFSRHTLIETCPP